MAAAELGMVGSPALHNDSNLPDYAFECGGLDFQIPMPKPLDSALTMGHRMEGLTNLRNSGDRLRSHRRYPIDVGIRCRALRSDEVVLGRICDISSGGVRFTSSEILAPGKKVEISIDWPVLLDGACRLQLRAQGLVVRNDQHGTAIEFERYDFYTRKAGTDALCGAGAVGI